MSVVTYVPSTVLLLEDNRDDERLALRAFRACGLPIVVRVARDGGEGLSALGLDPGGSQLKPPDLIVSDLKMPKLNGDELLRRARADARLRTVPFVMFSSSEEESDLIRCLSLGATAYCSKPVGFEEYLECAAGIISRWLPGAGEAREPVCTLDGPDGTLRSPEPVR